MDPSDAFQQTTTGFYRGVPDDVVVAALEHILPRFDKPRWIEDPTLANIAYLFARISQRSSSAHAAIEALQHRVDGQAARVVRTIASARNSSDFPSALDVPILGPAELDMLWAEFFVTGESDALRRIIGALDGPDRVRARMLDWLREWGLLGRGKRRSTAETLASVGLEVDLDRRAILTPGDLDCLCFTIAERGFPIFKHLPFQLEQSELLLLCAKGAAIWSLRLNAREHTIVRDACAAAREEPGGAGRLLLVGPAVGGRPFSP